MAGRLEHRPAGTSFFYVLDGRVVHDGARLELKAGQGWLPVQFVWTGIPSDRPHLRFDSGSVEVCEDDTLRWPEP